VASLLVDLAVYLVLKELSLVRRLSRASRVEAKLISSNPSLLDRKTKYYTAYGGLGWEQFALEGDPFESIARCGKQHLMLFILRYLYN
jgi:hypothetical protein